MGLIALALNKVGLKKKPKNQNRTKAGLMLQTTAPVTMVIAAMAVISTSNSSPRVLSRTQIPLTGFLGQKSSHPGQLLSFTNNTSKLLTSMRQTEAWKRDCGSPSGVRSWAEMKQLGLPLSGRGHWTENSYLHRHLSFNNPEQPFVWSKRPHKWLIINVIRKQPCIPATKLRVIPSSPWVVTRALYHFWGV